MALFFLRVENGVQLGPGVDGALRGSQSLSAGIGLMRLIPALCCFTGVWLEVSSEIKPNPRLFCDFARVPIVPIVVPFGGSYLESYKVIPKKELLWGLWVSLRTQSSQES